MGGTDNNGCIIRSEVMGYCNTADSMYESVCTEFCMAVTQDSSSCNIDVSNGSSGSSGSDDKKKGSGGKVVLILLVIGCAAGAGYFVYQRNQKKDDTLQENIYMKDE